MNKDQYGIEIPALPRMLRRLDAVCLCRAGGGNNPMSFGRKLSQEERQKISERVRQNNLGGATELDRQQSAENLSNVSESQRWFYNSKNTGPVNIPKKRSSSSRASILST